MIINSSCLKRLMKKIKSDKIKIADRYILCKILTRGERK